MRKITEDAVKAFYSDKKFKRTNTEVCKYNGEQVMWLYNTVIATLKEDELIISHGGYTTNTTKERLNGILSEYKNFKYGIIQKDFVWYLRNNEDGTLQKFDKQIRIKND